MGKELEFSLSWLTYPSILKYVRIVFFIAKLKQSLPGTYAGNIYPFWLPVKSLYNIYLCCLATLRIWKQAWFTVCLLKKLELLLANALFVSLWALGSSRFKFVGTLKPWGQSLQIFGNFRKFCCKEKVVVFYWRVVVVQAQWLSRPVHLRIS